MARPRLVECSFFIPVRRDREISDGERHQKSGLDVDTLEAALTRVGYALRIVPRPETPIPQRSKAGA
jgi:hypothetical protein